MIHTDLNQKFIETLPEKLRPYAVLARLDRPAGIWLLLLPGWWAIVLASGGVFAMTLHDWWMFVLFGIGAVVMRAAGCVINDLWDQDLDKKVGRTKLRPLASGAVTSKQAILFLALLLVAGFVILMQTALVTILLGILALPLIATYPLMKRYTWWPQAFLGLTFNFSALMGWSAVTGVLAIAPLLLYAGGIFWTLGYDTIYAHQDKDDDALAGIKSSALRLGDGSRKAVAKFYLAAWLLIAVGGIVADFHSLAFLFLLPALLHLIWQMASWNPGNPTSSLKTFKSNRDFGLLVLAAFALS
jgi:4-hydroxybenzoate polyprenyltransferase